MAPDGRVSRSARLDGDVMHGERRPVAPRRDALSGGGARAAPWPAPCPPHERVVAVEVADAGLERAARSCDSISMMVCQTGALAAVLR